MTQIQHKTKTKMSHSCNMGLWCRRSSLLLLLSVVPTTYIYHVPLLLFTQIPLALTTLLLHHHLGDPAFIRLLVMVSATTALLQHMWFSAVILQDPLLFTSYAVLIPALYTIEVTFFKHRDQDRMATIHTILAITTLTVILKAAEAPPPIPDFFFCLHKVYQLDT